MLRSSEVIAVVCRGVCHGLWCFT